MKRDGRDESTGPPTKMQKGDLSSVAVRFLIPARAAGLIIGKGGEHIKKIRSQYSVKLNIPDNRGIERVFTVEGELTAIANVFREIVPKIRDVMNAKLSDPKRMMGQQRPPRRRRGPNGDEIEDDDDEGMIDVRLLVHQSVAGSIIGRGGERIREFRSKHKMRVIKVYQMLAPGSTDRVVQLVAEPENAINCLVSVVEVIENTPVRGAVENYDSANSSESDALAYGGWLTPEGQRVFSEGMPMCGVPPMVQGPQMGLPRGMPPMARGGMFNRGPRAPAPHGPPNMYENGRMMSGPPPQLAQNLNRRVAYDQPPPFGAQGAYDGIPPMGTFPPLNKPLVGYEDPQGYYQPPTGPGDAMLLQSTGGYGGPPARGPPEMPVGPVGMPFKGSQPGMFAVPGGNYHNGPPDDGKSSQWGW